MLAERMEESLVLLAHRLCLPLFRMASLKKNARLNSKKVTLSKKDREALLHLQEVDWKVYAHFADKFQKEVETFGEQRMQDSVQELRRINEHVLYT